MANITVKNILQPIGVQYVVLGTNIVVFSKFTLQKSSLYQFYSRQTAEAIVIVRYHVMFSVILNKLHATKGENLETPALVFTFEF